MKKNEVVGHVEDAHSLDLLRDDVSVGHAYGMLLNGPDGEYPNECDVGLESHGCIDAIESCEASVPEANRRCRFVDGPMAPKVTSTRRKKPKKSMAQIMYGNKSSGVASSNESLADEDIADEDIEHRNLTIRKEAEATWEVSQSLGITFDCEKENILAVFMELENQELKGKKAHA